MHVAGDPFDRLAHLGDLGHRRCDQAGAAAPEEVVDQLHRRAVGELRDHRLDERLRHRPEIEAARHPGGRGQHQAESRLGRRLLAWLQKRSPGHHAGILAHAQHRRGVSGRSERPHMLNAAAALLWCAGEQCDDGPAAGEDLGPDAAHRPVVAAAAAQRRRPGRFLLYATVRIFWASYCVEDFHYLAPFYSPCLSTSCVPEGAPLRPAVSARCRPGCRRRCSSCCFPGGFRRPATTTGRPTTGRSGSPRPRAPSRSRTRPTRGETRFPLIFQNVAPLLLLRRGR